MADITSFMTGFFERENERFDDNKKRQDKLDDFQLQQMSTNIAQYRRESRERKERQQRFDNIAASYENKDAAKQAINQYVDRFGYDAVEKDAAQFDAFVKAQHDNNLTFKPAPVAAAESTPLPNTAQPSPYAGMRSGQSQDLQNQYLAGQLGVQDRAQYDEIMGGVSNTTPIDPGFKPAPFDFAGFKTQQNVAAKRAEFQGTADLRAQERRDNMSAQMAAQQASSKFASGLRQEEAAAESERDMATKKAAFTAITGNMDSGIDDATLSTLDKKDVKEFAVNSVLDSLIKTDPATASMTPEALENYALTSPSVTPATRLILRERIRKRKAARTDDTSAIVDAIRGKNESGGAKVEGTEDTTDDAADRIL